MNEVTVGVLTISDRCYRNEAIDESGPILVKLVVEGIIKNGIVVKTALVPDCKDDIQEVLINWCNEGINLILTTGGTGVAERDVTPEATAEVVTKTVPGISNLLFKCSSEITSLAALSRGIAGIRGKSLIINFPGSKKASKECLEAVACIIPHAVDLITGNTNNIELVHGALEIKKSSLITNNPAARIRKSAYCCISVAEAQKIIMERIFCLTKEKVVSYQKARGYVLAQNVNAQDNLPPFDVSLKDGYAVISSDKGFVRNLIGVSNAGNSLPNVKVLSQQCVRINTGAAIPLGADAVVQVEDTEVILLTEDQKEEKKITLKKLPSKGQDIRRVGSDFKVGNQLLSFGTYLDPGAIGYLAAAGATSVRVFDKPAVTVFSTGDEIMSPDEKLLPGKVRDSNRITLITLLQEENFEVVDLGIVRDNPEALKNSLEKGFQVSDVIVTTGSMSMGDRDYLKEILMVDFNAEICFGRVLMKPGKPTSFAVVNYKNKPKVWFGLPGNPASAFVTAQLFLLPALRKISGFEKVFPLKIRAQVSDLIPLEDRPHYVRGFLTYDEKQNSWFAVVNGNQSSSRIESCVNANCLLKFPKAKPSPSMNTNQVSSVTCSPYNSLSKKWASENKLYEYPDSNSNKEINIVEAFLIGKGYFRH